MCSTDSKITILAQKAEILSRVLPVLALLFLCSFLDRTNVGNAKLYGLAKDIHITDLQYDQGLAVFFATYIARSVDALPCRAASSNTIRVSL